MFPQQKLILIRNSSLSSMKSIVGRFLRFLANSFSNRSVSDTLSKLSLGRGVYLKNMDEELTADIYLYLEYGVKVPKVAVAIQKAVKDAVRNMADVELAAINIHVAGIVPDKTPKPELKDLFDEDFLND
nr:Asp23/Gls24 family envelope stress response protein [Streptococcus pneumoniae]